MSAAPAGMAERRRPARAIHGHVAIREDAPIAVDPHGKGRPRPAYGDPTSVTGRIALWFIVALTLCDHTAAGKTLVNRA